MVIKIAVCDDSLEYSEITSDMVKVIMERHKIEFNVNVFNTGIELIRSYGALQFDIIFLDMEMPELNGVETGLYLRKISKKTVIIYLTSHKEYAYDSYKVKARDYLLKPVDLEKLESVLINIINENSKDFLDVKDTDGVIHRIPVNEITHILRKKEDRKIHIYTLNKTEIIVVQTLENVEKDLINNEFIIRSSKSCIINMKNVRTMIKNTIYFSNDTIEYASRRCMTDLENKLNIRRK